MINISIIRGIPLAVTSGNDLYILAKNYNASIKLRPTLVKVTNFDSIFYR